MNNLIRTIIVEDDAVFLGTICPLLENSDGITVVGTANNGENALAMIHELRPDVILLDVDTLYPDSSHMIVWIYKLSPSSKVIVISSQSREHLVLDAFREGARGHLIKGRNQPREIVAAIRAVNRGESVLSPRMAGRILDEMARQRQFQIEGKAHNR